jgi:hypothetical protein
MGLGIARGRGDGGAAVLVDRQEVVRLGRGEHRIDGDADIAIGAVLETDRAGEPGGELAMDLAFGGARADGAPGDEIDDVLGRHHVEELAGRRQAERIDVEQQAARQAQALVDAEAAVEAGIVDQALPADRGARLLEVDAHQDLELAGMAHPFRGQAGGVLARRGRIVDRAWADDDDETVVALVEDAADGLARAVHRVGDGKGGGRLGNHLGGGRKRFHALDAQVVDGMQHGRAPVVPGTRGGNKKAARVPWRRVRRVRCLLVLRPNGPQPAPKASDSGHTKNSSGARRGSWALHTAPGPPCHPRLRKRRDSGADRGR